MSVNGHPTVSTFHLLTYLLGEPDSISIDNRETVSPHWFSPDLLFCVSASAPKIKSYTFGQLKRYVKELASGLRRAGLQDGDRLMLFAPDSLYVPLVMLATLAAEGIFVTRGIDSTAKQQAHFIEHAEPKIVLAHEGYEETAMEAARMAGQGRIRPYTFGALAHSEEIFKTLANGFDNWNMLFDRINGPKFHWHRHLNPAEMNKTILIEYTSGSTSDPKGVEHTHASLTHWLIGSPPSPHQKVIYSDFSFSQSIAKAMFLSSLKARSKIIIPDEPFTLPTYLGYLSHFQPQVVVAIKRSIDALVSCTTEPDLSFIQFIYCGAQIIPLKTRLAINALCGHRNVMLVGYGSTETGNISGSIPWHPPRESTCQGFLGQGVQGKVVDEQGSDLPHGEQGKLLFRTPGMMKGYWRDPDLTAMAIDGDGYLDTGDIGYVDRETGEWHVTGRVKEIIKVQGRSVSPNAIEEALLQLDFVVVAVVVAVLREEDGEELPTAFIVRDGDDDVKREDDERKAHAIVKEELNEYHRLTGGVIFLAPEEVPHGGNGKIMKRELKLRAQNMWDKRRIEDVRADL